MTGVTNPRWTIDPVSSAADIDGIMAVEHASFTNPWTREMYLAELENQGLSFLYVAKDPMRRVIGFCSFWRVTDELHINNLAVEPPWRRQGLGGALLQRALKAGAGLGAVMATLEVRRSNADAQQLYARFGFSVTGVRRDYYSSPVEDALILSRKGLDTETFLAGDERPDG